MLILKLIMLHLQKFAYAHDLLFSPHHLNRMRYYYYYTYFKQNGYDSTEEVKCNANIYAGTQQSGHPPLPVNVTSRASTRWSLRWHIHLEKPSSFQLPTDGGVFSCSICWNFIKSILPSTRQMFPVPQAAIYHQSIMDPHPIPNSWKGVLGTCARWLRVLLNPGRSTGLLSWMHPARLDVL